MLMLCFVKTLSVPAQRQLFELAGESENVLTQQALSSAGVPSRLSW